MEKIKQKTNVRHWANLWLIMAMAIMIALFLRGGVTVQAEENDTPVSISGTTYVVNGEEYDSEYYLPELSVGDELTFKVETEGGIGDISYKWYYEEVPGNGLDPIEGQTQDTLTVSKKKKGTETYCCEVKDSSTDQYNDYRYFYIPAIKTLTVTGYINDEENSTIEAKENDTIKLKVNAQTTEDASEITYRWFGDDNEELSDTGNEVTVTKKAGNEQYYCMIEDGMNTEYCHFYLNEKSTVIINKTSYIMNGERYDECDLPELSVGDEITLSVEAESSVSDLRYQWYHWETIEEDGNEYQERKEIPGETKSTLKIKKNNLSGEQYACEISDDKTSNTVYFMVPSAKTLKTTQYISVDGNKEEVSSIDVIRGKTATMKVDVTSIAGNDKITYQWYDTSDEPIEEATEASYTVEKGTGDESYYCVINDTVNSTRCYFTLKEENTFSNIKVYINDRIMDEEEGTVYKGGTKEGKTYRLSVIPTSTYENATYTYRWYKSDNEKETLGTDSNLSVTKTGELEDIYYIEITNDAGTTRTIKFYLEIKTTDGLNIIAYTDGEYYAKSGVSRYRVEKGKTVKLHIDALAESGENITYDWQKMDKDEWEYVSTGETGDTYITDSIDSYEENYKCIVTCGREVEGVTFYLGAKKSDGIDNSSLSPYIIVDGVKENSNGTQVDTGTEVTMGVDIEELPESIKESDISYEWYKTSWGEADGESLSNKKECTVTSTSSGGEYICKIKVNGKDESDYTFYIDTNPDITADISVDSKSINNYENNNYGMGVDSFDELYGKKVSIKAKNRLNAEDEFSYKWYKTWHDENYEEKEELLSETNEITLTKDLLSDDTHIYLYCLVTNKADIKEKMSVELYIYDHTEDDIEQYINDENTDKEQFATGTKVTLKVKLPDQVVSKMTYEWYDEDGNKIDCQGTEYTVTKSNDEERYTCIVTDQYGDSRSCEFTLYPDTKLVPQRYVNGKKQTQNYCTVKPNSIVTLEVRVNPEDGATYQWYKAGDEDVKWELTGETKSVLSVKSGDYGDYDCVVTRKNERAWAYFGIAEETCSHENVEVVPAVAATCEKNGLTEGKRCKECGETLVEQTVVKAVGHKWDNGTVTTPATTTATGVKTFTCTVCKKTKTEVIPKLTEKPGDTTKPEQPDKKPEDTTTKPEQPDEKPGNTTKPEQPDKKPGNTTTKPEQPDKKPGNTTTKPAQPNKKPAIKNTTLKTGTKVTDKKSNASYKVTGKETVQYTATTNKKASKVTVPSTVTVKGVKYQVTSIAANAFKNNKKLKTVVIPASVRSIGKQAFAGCKNLKKITIKTPYLTKKSVGAKAFKGIAAKATIKVPKKQLKAYKKLLKAKGIGKKVRIK